MKHNRENYFVEKERFLQPSVVVGIIIASIPQCTQGVTDIRQ